MNDFIAIKVVSTQMSVITFSIVFCTLEIFAIKNVNFGAPALLSWLSLPLLVSAQVMFSRS